MALPTAAAIITRPVISSGSPSLSSHRLSSWCPLGAFREDGRVRPLSCTTFTAVSFLTPRWSAMA